MVGSLLALGLLAFAKTPPPAPLPAHRVLVRVVYVAAAAMIPLDAVIRSVTSIWKPYADITFADAADVAKGGYDDELHLVVSDRLQVDQSGAPALGWISFVKPGQPLNVVTVSVASARALMARETWLGRRFEQLPGSIQQQFLERAVSWSIAHEIGHYLLRTSAHAAHGLMRAQLTASEILLKDRRSTRLEPREIEMLRERVSRTGLLADADAPAARSE
jgi:hypothetical protein